MQNYRRPVYQLKVTLYRLWPEHIYLGNSAGADCILGEFPYAIILGLVHILEKPWNRRESMKFLTLGPGNYALANTQCKSGTFPGNDDDRVQSQFSHQGTPISGYPGSLLNLQGSHPFLERPATYPKFWSSNCHIKNCGRISACNGIT